MRPAGFSRMVKGHPQVIYSVDTERSVMALTVDKQLTHKILIRRYLVEADISPFVEGFPFHQVRENKVKAKFGRTFTWFAAFDNLTQMKKPPVVQKAWMT